MAARAARQHHFLWHQVRNMWLAYDDDTRAELAKRGWEPPRPSQGPPPSQDVLLDNGSGEDFLYMHREMIGAVNRLLTDVADPAYPQVVGWPQVPDPADTEYPVPPAWMTGNARLDEFLVTIKSDHAYERMVEWEGTLRDPNRLRQWSLGRLGALVEYTVHNEMHMRWSAESEIRPDVDPASPDSIPEEWDRPSYDWLGDPYSSHVNSVFWKIHGWVDARIDDWMSANGHTGEVPWSTGTPWVGQMPEGHDHDDPHVLLAVATLTDAPTWNLSGPPLTDDEVHHHTGDMDVAIAAVLASGRFHQFYDRAELPDLLA